jgi:hypothetical protein
MDVAASHVNVMEWADAVVDGPGEGTNSGEGDKKANSGNKEPAARAVGDVLVDEISKASLMQQQEQGTDTDHQEDQEYPGTVHGNRVAGILVASMSRRVG